MRPCGCLLDACGAFHTRCHAQPNAAFIKSVVSGAIEYLLAGTCCQVSWTASMHLWLLRNIWGSGCMNLWLRLGAGSMYLILLHSLSCILHIHFVTSRELHGMVYDVSDVQDELLSLSWTLSLCLLPVIPCIQLVVQ